MEPDLKSRFSSALDRLLESQQERLALRDEKIALQAEMIRLLQEQNASLKELCKLAGIEWRLCDDCRAKRGSQPLAHCNEATRQRLPRDTTEEGTRA